MIRFYCGDALSFCHTIQHKRSNPDDSSANLYRRSYTFEPLVLEQLNAEDDWASSFNVIDTSNLIDHLGAINLLVASAPLLDRTTSAVLYTETLVRKEKNHRDFADRILCGNFATMSVLLDLFPIEYWTNAEASSSADEALMGVLKSEGQSRARLIWKRPFSGSFHSESPVKISNAIEFDETDLANILYQVYLNMFQSENISYLMKNTDMLSMNKMSLAHSHRGTLAVFIRYVRAKVQVNWENMIESLISLIEEDSTIMLGGNWIQELYLQLHMTSVYTVPAILPSSGLTRKVRSSKSPLAGWEDVPSVVCVTLEIPRKDLSFFTNSPFEEVGSPLLQCRIESTELYSGNGWQNLFADISLAFGTIQTEDDRNTEKLKLKVKEDSKGWGGTSPLIASFHVPSWILMQDPEGTSVSLAILSTPQAAMMFAKKLGPQLHVSRAGLCDRKRVYITKHRPNQSGHPRLCSTPKMSEYVEGSTPRFHFTTSAKVHRQSRRMTALAFRLSLSHEKDKALLREGASVETAQLSAHQITIFVGKKQIVQTVNIPIPVQSAKLKTLIARKSSYVELVCPISDMLTEERMPEYMFPMLVQNSELVLWNMPRIPLECLPILDTSQTKQMQWLITHASMMWSQRERRLRELAMASSVGDARVNFKDGLFSLIMHSTGLQGDKARVFGLNNANQGGVHILIFVSSLRLDVANHTVVLDAAVLPLTEALVPRLSNAIGPLQRSGLCSINVDDDELKLWKHVIPAFVERCRQYDHRPSCEYVSQQKVPLSTENGKPLICSCGSGKLPANFMPQTPQWNIFAKHSTRAAISPIFYSALVEQPFELGKDQVRKLNAVDTTACAKCGKGQEDVGGQGLKICGRCKVVKYCSESCQKSDWKTHKQICRPA